MNMFELTEKQKAYYDERVSFFKSLRSGGRKVAIPTGLIYSTAMKMTDKECEEWLLKYKRCTTNLN